MEHRIKPRECARHERRRRRTVAGGVGREAVVHPPPLATLRDQPRLAQDRKVLRDRGRREGKELDELTNADLTLAQRPDDAQSRGIREGEGDIGEFVHMAQECRSGVDLSGLEWTQHQFVDQRNDRQARKPAPTRPASPRQVDPQSPDPNRSRRAARNQRGQSEQPSAHNHNDHQTPSSTQILSPKPHTSAAIRVRPPRPPSQDILFQSPPSTP